MLAPTPSDWRQRWVAHSTTELRDLISKVVYDFEFLSINVKNEDGDLEELKLVIITQEHSFDHTIAFGRLSDMLGRVQLVLPTDPSERAFVLELT